MAAPKHDLSVPPATASQLEDAPVAGLVMAGLVGLTLLLLFLIDDDDQLERQVPNVRALSSSCNPPDAPSEQPTVGSLPEGQRLAWVSGGSLWALVENCPWPRQVSFPSLVDPESPGWSPDGQWLAFLGDSRLQLRSFAGADPRLYARSTSFAWMPDSRRLVFTFPLGPRLDDGEGIWIGHVGNRSVTKLADAAGNGVALSPDGSTVAFWRDEPCPSEAEPFVTPAGIVLQCSAIWSVETSGESPQRLTGSSALLAVLPEDVRRGGRVSRGSDLQWSPDSSRLTFKTCGIASASICQDSRNLFVIDGDGSSLRYVYSTVGPVEWSADSSQFVTVSRGGRYYDAYERPLVLINPATGSAEQISPSEVEDTEPGWSPLSNLLVFASSPPVRTKPCTACPPEVQEQGIWTMRIDGSERRQLTSAPDWLEYAPRWSADGEWILFSRSRPKQLPEQAFAEYGLWAMRNDGAELHQLAEFEDPNAFIYDWWSGDPRAN